MIKPGIQDGSYQEKEDCPYLVRKEHSLFVSIWTLKNFKGENISCKEKKGGRYEEDKENLSLKVDSLRFGAVIKLVEIYVGQH